MGAMFAMFFSMLKNLFGLANKGIIALDQLADAGVMLSKSAKDAAKDYRVQVAAERSAEHDARMAKINKKRATQKLPPIKATSASSKALDKLKQQDEEAA